MINLKEIAKQLDITYQTFFRIIKGERNPSPKLAKILEEKTGVPRLAWLYPDEFFNPIIDAYYKEKKKKKEGGKMEIITQKPITYLYVKIKSKDLINIQSLSQIFPQYAILSYEIIGSSFRDKTLTLKLELIPKEK